ncbi:MAG TPA: enoyl-CoA hydratase/isomerase family protein, partial [Thermoanaerobaculia bacterium]
MSRGGAPSVRLRRFGESVAGIVLDRPPVNVLRLAELESLAETLTRVAPARAVVLSSSGTAFSAGVDVAEHEPDPARIDAMLAAMRSALRELVGVPAVTIAAVRGACLGGAAELVLACDLAVVAEDARIGFPEIRLSCFPPAAAVLLGQAIGAARANDWILTG